MHICKRHEKIVRKLSEQVQYFYKHNIPFRIYKGSTNSTRILSFEKDKLLDIRKLNKIISVNSERQTAIVEPNVPMDSLVNATLKKDLIPQVVMEFPGITVAGGIQGGAGESSSFKYGLFSEITNWYELILADGSVVRASKYENPDLFWACAGSYGTLGIIVAAEINLIKAKKYVELEYIPVDRQKEALELISSEIKNNHDYIDSILFTKHKGLVMIGTLTDQEKYKKITFQKATDDWFYLHAQAINKRTIETIPIIDYLFRYDRGGFWTGRFCFAMFNTPFNRFTRWLLNPLLKARKMYPALQASGVSQQWIIQDLCLPAEKTEIFLKYAEHNFSIYPLWICPLMPDDKSVFVPTNLKTKLVINIGMWGKFNGTHDCLIAANRSLEDKVFELGGKKVLYAQAYYNEKDFWDIYGGKSSYDRIRSKYKAAYLPSIYDKVTVSKHYPVNGKRGVLFAILGLNGIRIK